MSKKKTPTDGATRKRIRDYLWIEAGSEPGTVLQAIDEITQIGHYHGFDVWQARLVFADRELWVWIVPEPMINYYFHRGQVSEEQSKFGNPDDVVLFHIGFLTSIREERRQRRFEAFEPSEGQGAKDSGGEIIRIGKNTKVSVLAQRLIKRFLEQGQVELEMVGAGAINQAVKAIAKARQTLEAEGYSLVVIPELVQVPLGHGSQTTVHLTVIDMYGS